MRLESVQFSNHAIKLLDATDGITFHTIVWIARYEFQHFRMSRHTTQCLNCPQVIEHHCIDVSWFKAFQRALSECYFVARLKIGHHALALHSAPQIGGTIERCVHVVVGFNGLIIIHVVKSASKIILLHGKSFITIRFVSFNLGFSVGFQHFPFASEQPIHRYPQTLTDGC